MAKGYFPTLINQEEIRNKVDSLVGSLANHVAAWTAARAAKVDNLDTAISSRAPANTALSSGIWTNARASRLDNIQTVLNTPDGNTLAAWISAVNTNAASANTYAQQAVNSANNAYNKSNEANGNAYQAYINAMSAANMLNEGTFKRAFGTAYACHYFGGRSTSWSYNGKGEVFIARPDNCLITIDGTRIKEIGVTNVNVPQINVGFNSSVMIGAGGSDTYGFCILYR